MLNNTQFFNALQGLAAKDTKGGVFVLTSYGQDPATGGNLPPKVWKINAVDINSIYTIIEQNQEPHRNFYLGLHLMRTDLPSGRKGGINDIVAVLGFVADFDDPWAPEYMHRIPQGLVSSYVLETSENRFQCGILLADPLYDLNQAKDIATRLKSTCQCDHGTADISHVWRLPDTWNWPNKKKVDGGRHPDPQHVKFLTGEMSLNTPEDMLTALVPQEKEGPLLRPAPSPGVPNTHSIEDDMALLKTSFGWKNGLAIKRLFDGDTSEYEGDHSAADLALCNHLCLILGPDKDRIDRVFRQTGLYRDKWDAVHRPADGSTYGQMTIETAINSSNERARKLLKAEPIASVASPVNMTAILENALVAAVADPGAPYEPKVIEAMRFLNENIPADFARYRIKFKNANNDISVTRIDELVKAGVETREAESKADELVELVKSQAELFHNPEGEGFLTYDQDGHKENVPIDSPTCENRLEYLYYKSKGRAAGDLTIKTVKSALMGIAKFDGQEHETFLRVALYNNGYVIDLCNDAWEVVLVTPSGREILQDSPVKFFRTQNMKALLTPPHGGDINLLWQYVNIAPIDQPLFLAWLLECYRPDTPYLIAELIGGQGTAKSTTQNNIRDLIDPNAVNLRAAPKTPEDTFVSACNNCLVSYNNLSHLSAPMQDTLCTLSTGGGFASRTLYTNSEESVMDTKRPVILNGISTLATAQDLIDRTLHFDLDPITEYKEESQLKENFTIDKPAIFGGILDLFVDTLKRLPDITIKRSPRMADFARLGEAMMQAMGHGPGVFLSMYEEKRRQAVINALDSSPVALALQECLDRNEHSLNDILMKQLLLILSYYRPIGGAWPKSPRGLGDILRRNQPGLKAAGIEVVFNPVRAKNGMKVSIHRIPSPPDNLSKAPQHTQSTPPPLNPYVQGL